MGIYTDSTKVAELLQIPAFDGTTTPTSTVVETIITRKEDKIDSKTGHAWRTVTVTDEYIDPTSIYVYGTGIRLDLSHRQITQFASGTDKLEIWNGNEWLDYVANKTEGRNSDYWIDYTNGVIYITNRSSVYAHGIRVTYRYGESVVSGTVEEACTKMAAIDVLAAYEQNLVFTDDGGTHKPNIQQRIDLWKEDVSEILSNLQEYNIL